MKLVNSQVNKKACSLESRISRFILPNHPAYANVVWMQFSCMLSSTKISGVRDLTVFSAWKSERQMFDVQMCVPK